ncbi:hypothetical protein CEE36_06785 [candidate division TA06 bacterium B3_TA06]|uniref:Uncharacterized protein n=1 Tax=candidate division TA06 bacterium B3_TA06 TaxID=2012487 RepID=A0A532V6F8_UNCT6|nr:MAG: hypothetical protein CEE36_06785 [candidate division TA06 bacterium B3_TA06]
MTVALFISLIIAGAGQILVELLSKAPIGWIRVLQIAAAAGVIGFLVCAWHERGLFYALLTALIAALAGGLVGRFMSAKLIQILLIFGVEVLFVGLIKLGDALGRQRQALRWFFGLLGGVIAGLLVFGIVGTIIAEIGGFFKGTKLGLPFILEVGVAVPSALLVTRILLGERKTLKPEKELE